VATAGGLLGLFLGACANPGSDPEAFQKKTDTPRGVVPGETPAGVEGGAALPPIQGTAPAESFRAAYAVAAGREDVQGGRLVGLLRIRLHV